MARIRTIKPEFFTSEDIVEMEPLARLLYIALWCEADKEGRFAWKPKTFKMRYLPGDQCDIQEVCNALVDADLVRLYGDGLAYIPTFHRHQHINPRESVSSLAPPPDFCPTPKRITPDVRKHVMDRDGHQCVRCGSTDQLALDHILPQCFGGPHIPENLRVLCKGCNSARPVSGEALHADLNRDGFTLNGLLDKFGIDASARVSTRHVEEVTRREEGRKEGKGKEGREGNLSEPSPDAPPIDPDAELAGDAPTTEAIEKRTRRRGTEEDEKCARWLYGQLLNVLPSAKEPNWNGWSDDVRLMREVDKRTHHEICELFLWATKDAFWCRNILSPSKLREKWDQLQVVRQMPAARTGAAGKPSAYQVAHIDHSETDRLMAEDMARRGTTMPADGNLEF